MESSVVEDAPTFSESVAPEAMERNLGRKEVVYLPLNQLHYNEYNPPSRMELSGLNHLIKSIKDDGLQYPILVSKKGPTEYTVIDGHRRLAAYKAEKHEEMPCIVADGNPSSLFSVVNSLSKAMKGTEWAIVFCNGGVVPAGITKNNLHALSRLIGNDAIREMASKGQAAGVYQTARRTVRYAYEVELTRSLGDETKENRELLTKVVVWLIEHKQSANCQAIIRDHRQGSLIKDAVEANQPIVV